MSSVLEQSYELVDVESLTPHPDNPRVGEVGTIAASIDAHGFYGAVVVQKSTGYVLAGNHRLAAARAKGIGQVPAIFIDADDTLAKRILVVDNRAAEKAEWDFDALSEVLAQVAEVDDDLTGLGWDSADLDSILAGAYGPTEESDDEDADGEGRAPSTGDMLELADVAWGEPDHIVHHGEVWQIGPHTLVVAKLHDEHGLWRDLLTGDVLFAPYPEPYLTCSTVATERPLLLVQPNVYLAGHLLDKHASAHPADVIKLRDGGPDAA